MGEFTMHAGLTVALPGDIDPAKLQTHLDEVMDRYDENRKVEPHSLKGEKFVSTRDEELFTIAKMMARKPGENCYSKHTAAIQAQYATMTEEERLANWNGVTEWDEEGWPISTSNPEGKWDYWRVGGRWDYAWVLKEGGEQGPLESSHNDWDNAKPPQHGRVTTNNARKRDINPESIGLTFSYMDLEGEWHDREIWTEVENSSKEWYGGRDWEYSKVPENEWGVEFFGWLASLPADTWLVCIDYHN